MASLLPLPELQFLDQNGKPYAGGKLYTYIPGLLTTKNTWQDANQVTLNENPIILDSAGRAIIFGDGDYRFRLFDADDNLIYDQLTSSTLSTDSISPVILLIISIADHFLSEQYRPLHSCVFIRETL